MNTFRRHRLTAAVVTALMLPMLAVAQAPAAADPSAAPKEEAKSQASSLSQVTVTARKREETIADVPVAVTARRLFARFPLTWPGSTTASRGTSTCVNA